MSATPFTAGKFRAFYPTGINGDAAPLAGGKLYSYAAGTLTAQPTYTDQSGTVANSNPVILDANGEANVWLTGIYKFILQDPTGTQLWSEDNFSDTIFSTAFSATSTTSLGLATGSRTFVTQAGKAFAPGQFLVAASNATPSAFVSGSVTSYSGTTLVLNIASIGVPAGTYADWNIGLSGPAGIQGPPGTSGTGSGNVTGPGTSNVGYLATFGNTSGTVLTQGTGGPGTAAYKDAGTSANQVLTLDGSALVPTAVQGTGTASASTFLRGDRTWANPSIVSFGAVGFIGFLAVTGTNSVFNPGDTTAGSNLQYCNAGISGAGNTVNGSVTPSGTWQCNGYIANGVASSTVNKATVWQRIA